MTEFIFMLTHRVAHSNVLYFPFPGRVVDHPSALEGTADEIVASARELSARHGVHGLDLMAYRFAGDVPDLVNRVVQSRQAQLSLPAASIRSTRLRPYAVLAPGHSRVGCAVFDAEFPAPPTTRDQGRLVLDAL